MSSKSLILRSFGIVILVLGSAGAAAAQNFALTGSLNAARSNHTATLLNDGRVLIAGGYDIYGDAVGTAEVYLAGAGRFVPTGSLVTPRYDHTATRLTNGQVLIAGGSSSLTSDSLATAELYDPATGQFTATGSMLERRVGHTATLLNDGRVLIAGGRNKTAYLSTAEIYDPATGQFASTGPMYHYDRTWHTATLLPDSTVLIAGGFGGGWSGSELYDPATGLFALTAGTMNWVHYFHSATLLPTGRVLIADGLGGTEGWEALAELYDPAAQTFTATGRMVTPRGNHTATLLPNGHVLIAGGEGADMGPGGIGMFPPYDLALAELYDPWTGAFAATGTMNFPRKGHTATLLKNGLVLVAGGHSFDDDLEVTQFPAAAELYGGAVSVTMCHRAGRKYTPMNLNRAAAGAHGRHGDASVGEPVPGMPGYVFSSSCQPVSE